MSPLNSQPSQEILVCARRWIGTPYRHQASVLQRGCDCLGLVRGVWRDIIGEEPTLPPAYTPDWVERCGDDPLYRAAQQFLQPIPIEKRMPGHVLLFRMKPHSAAKHMGIQSAPLKFIHAYAGHSVCESWLSHWWRSRLVGVFAFPEKSL